MHKLLLQLLLHLLQLLLLRLRLPPLLLRLPLLMILLLPLPLLRLLLLPVLEAGQFLDGLVEGAGAPSLDQGEAQTHQVSAATKRIH